MLNVSATLGAGSGLSANQQSVANALNSVFNAGGTLPSSFGALFGLTGGSLNSGAFPVGRRSGDRRRAHAFQLMAEFSSLMLDPFVTAAAVPVGRRAGDGLCAGQAGEPAAGHRARLCLGAQSAASDLRPALDRLGPAYGGSNIANGDPSAGSSNVTTRLSASPAGMDYRYSPDTIFGFALAGGGTNWGLASGLGTGRSDAFQAGVYGITRSGRPISPPRSPSPITG